MADGQGQHFPTAVEPLELHGQRDPLGQDVYDAVRMACYGGLTGGDIIATVQQAIAEAREDAPAPLVQAAA